MLISEISKSIENNRDNPYLNNSGYDTGLLGICLFYTLLNDYESNLKYREYAIEYFEKGLYSIQNKFSPLYKGDTIDNHIGQIGRFIYFIKNHSLYNEFELHEYLNHLDEIAKEVLISKMKKNDFDITSGALASGAYFLLRDSDTSITSIQSIIFSLDSSKKISNKNQFYWVSPSLGNRVYLGISHGSAMIINFLLKAINKNIEKQLCIHLLKGAAYYLISQKRYTPFIGLFDNYIGEYNENKQFALCYGDLGLGIVLYKTANILEDNELKKQSIEILNSCLLRKYEDELTLDASILYGVSGLNIAFNEAYSLTNNIKFLDRANYWLKMVSKYSIHDNEYSGFKSRLVDSSPLWDLSFGWGIIGIGCTLINNETHSFPSLSPLTFLQ
ncbi:lanthionine synthetase LanC family protein [Chishuiella sp.]|uniref:lanthionine synthetase LanC family protein n=1 Tax=Chishuiella sp. TaxID=1969467 RepID=UPI0028A7B7E4|nr:lanthionine synthetase LanC family protein [Chishuiella sp.]